MYSIYQFCLQIDVAMTCTIYIAREYSMKDLLQYYLWIYYGKSLSLIVIMITADTQLSIVVQILHFIFVNKIRIW